MLYEVITCADLRDKLGVASDGFLLLNVGSRFQTKGVDRAIRAIAALPIDIRRRTKLAVVGDDNPRPFHRLAKSLRVGRITSYNVCYTKLLRCCLPLLPRVWACSEFATHACLRHPQLLRELIDSGDLSGPYQGDVLTRRVSQYVAQAVDETDLKRRLRELRRRELLRIAWRDLAGWSELAEVMSTLSTLASYNFV